MEKYRINSANSFYLALSEVYPMFCRVEEKYSGYDSRLGSVSEGSSILKVDENGKRRIDNECPVIAYGFSAFLLAHSVKDGSEAGFLWQGDWTSARNLREVYFNKAFAKYKEDNRRKYMAADGDECTITKLDSRFFDEHLSKEKELLNRTESLDKGLADGLWQVVRVEVEKYLVEVEERITASEGEKKEPTEELPAVVREIFGGYANQFLFEAKRQKDGTAVAELVNLFVKEGKAIKTRKLFQPLYKALAEMNVISIGKSTWNNAIK